MRGGSKDFWFVLTSESLAWYKDDEVLCFMNMLRLAMLTFLNLGERQEVHDAVGGIKAERFGRRTFLPAT